MTFFDSDDDGLSDISETDLFEALDSAREKCVTRDTKTQQQLPKPHLPKQSMPPPKIPAQPKKRPLPSFLPQSRDVNQAHFSSRNKSRDLKSPPPESLSWAVKYQPKNASEIAINPKKYTEIYNTLLESVTSAVGRVLIISGPAGSSKTTALNQAILDVSKHLQKPPAKIEWSNPAHIYQSPSPQAFHKAVSEYMFLRQDECVRVIVVEDLPNIMHEGTRIWFRRAVEEYLNYIPEIKLAPLVFVVSENDNNESQSFAESHTVESIFTRDLLNHPRIRRVKVASVGKTFMHKPLLEIILAEAGSKHVTVGSTKAIPRKLTLSPKSIYRPCMEVAYVLGDIRSAINALEFCHRSAASSNGVASDDYIRPDQVSFFRAMGRVFFGTKKDTSRIDHDVIGGLLAQWGDDLGARNNIVDYLFALAVRVGITTDINFIYQLSETSSIGAVNASGKLSSADSIEYLLRQLHYLFNQKNSPKQFGTGNLFKQGIDARRAAFEKRKELDEKVHENHWTCRQDMVLFEDYYTNKIRATTKTAGSKTKAKEEAPIFELTGKPFTSLASLGDKLDLEDDFDLMEAMNFSEDDEWV
ncbi:Checkpoint protein [Yarrowia sp. C11]|nr:Checkpoint protein [Yarrowia sp. C11]